MEHTYRAGSRIVVDARGQYYELLSNGSIKRIGKQHMTKAEKKAAKRSRREVRP